MNFETQEECKEYEAWLDELAEDEAWAKYEDYHEFYAQ